MRQRTWWTLGAGLIAVLELVFSAGIWIERLTEDRTRDLGNGVTLTVPSELGPVWGAILVTGAVALAASAIFAGLYLRRRRPEPARALIVVGLVPSVLSGVVFFWFPPMWLISAVAIAVVVGVSRSDMRAPVAG